MRNIFTVVGTILLVAGIALIFFFIQNKNAGSDASLTQAGSASAAVAVPFERIANGVRSTVKERVNYAISSSGQMAELWTLLDKSGVPPAIDFNRQMVIAVFAGEKPAVGYGISVSKVTDADQRLVTVTLQNPEGTCTSKSSNTAPYEIIVVPIAPLPLAHQDTSATVACPK
ncbi:MAG: protease complex subunit PrcB family protein [bacterium]|nr:protease complex subunit PrcB family protein [bacterium]MDO8742414.1 protease complex subunit PrcB family protein [bacterium]